jgi:hypothetical protein
MSDEIKTYTVTLEVAEIIDNDFEGFLDLLTYHAVGDGNLLEDISYHAIGVTPEGDIIFKVEGYLIDLSPEDAFTEEEKEI